MDYATCSDEVLAEALNRLLATDGEGTRELREFYPDLVEFVSTRAGLFARSRSLAERCDLLEKQLALIVAQLDHQAQEAVLGTGLLRRWQLDVAHTYYETAESVEEDT